MSISHLFLPRSGSRPGTPIPPLSDGSSVSATSPYSYAHSSGFISSPMSSAASSVSSLLPHSSIITTHSLPNLVSPKPINLATYLRAESAAAVGAIGGILSATQMADAMASRLKELNLGVVGDRSTRSSASSLLPPPPPSGRTSASSTTSKAKQQQQQSSYTTSVFDEDDSDDTDSYYTATSRPYSGAGGAISSSFSSSSSPSPSSSHHPTAQPSRPRPRGQSTPTLSRTAAFEQNGGGSGGGGGGGGGYFFAGAGSSPVSPTAASASGIPPSVRERVVSGSTMGRRSS